MPAPSYSYTLTNGTTADADEVMSNFNAILNGVTDGSKDLSVANITIATAAKFSANSQVLSLIPSASLAATYSLTLPTNVPSGSNYTIRSTTAGVLSFGHPGVTGATGADSDTTLTLSSDRVQVITPTANREYTLPTTNVKAGDTFSFVNKAAISSSVLSVIVKSSGGNTIATLFPQMSASIVALQDTPTSASHWMVIGNLVSDWFSYTPATFSTGFGDVTNKVFEWRRVGNEMEIRGNFTLGNVSANAGNYFSLPVTPSTISVNTSRVNGDSANMLGIYTSKTTAGADMFGANVSGHLVYDSTQGATYLGLARGNNGGDKYGANANVSANMNSNAYLDLFAHFPVSGWTANSG
jgi:hypothetical protein